jgi:hypothetical protein
MWKISIIALLFLMTVAVARAEEPEPNCVQRAVIHVDRMLREVKAELFDGDRQEFFNDFMPVDDFRLYVKPNWKKSMRKGQAHYTVGFKFTF